MKRSRNFEAAAHDRHALMCGPATLIVDDGVV
jgi:hypothetical protein